MVHHVNEERTYCERLESTAAVGLKELPSLRAKLKGMYDGDPRYVHFEPARNRDSMGRLMERFTRPEELFGPPDLIALKGQPRPTCSHYAPGVVDDCVHFSVSTAAVMRPGQSYIIDVWAHLQRQLAEVKERALAESGADFRMKTKGPVEVARGTVVTVRLRIPGLVVEQPEDTILWKGGIGNAMFVVHVDAGAAAGRRIGSASVRVSGLEIIHLDFEIMVGERPTDDPTRPVVARRHRQAFASYASDDEDAVLARVQGILKGVPDLKIFLARKDLRPGEPWQKRPQEEVISRDVMYLFWSAAASQSRYVDMEWRIALEHHGIGFIDPVPLVSPREVPPPKELVDEMHFDDWVLAFMSSK